MPFNHFHVHLDSMPSFITPLPAPLSRSFSFSTSYPAPIKHQQVNFRAWLAYSVSRLTYKRLPTLATVQIHEIAVHNGGYFSDLKDKVLR